MKKIWILLLIMLCSIYIAEARSGIGISPGCHPIDAKGKCIYQDLAQDEIREISISVYNFDDDTKHFTISVESDIDNIEFKPKEFTLQKDERVKCEDSPGCQKIKIKINASNTSVGPQTVMVKAAAKISTGGLLEINQIVGSKLLLNITSEKEEELPWTLPEDINNSKGEIVNETIKNGTDSDNGEKRQSNFFKMGIAGIIILIIIILYKKSKKGKKKKVYKHKEGKEIKDEHSK